MICSWGWRAVGIIAAVMTVHPGYAQAPATDPRAEDATSAFMTFCVSSFASSVGAHALLDNHPEIARPLDAASLAPFIGAQAERAREGWLYKTPHDAWLALAYLDLGHGGCQIVVREMDATTLKSALTRAVNDYARLTKAKLDTKPVKQEQMEGVPSETIAWEMAFPDLHKTVIIVSAASHPVSNKQALLNLGDRALKLSVSFIIVFLISSQVKILCAEYR